MHFPFFEVIHEKAMREPTMFDLILNSVGAEIVEYLDFGVKRYHRNEIVVFDTAMSSQVSRTKYWFKALRDNITMQNQQYFSSISAIWYKRRGGVVSSIRFEDGVTDITVQSIAEECPSLKTVEFNDFTERPFSFLAQRAWPDIPFEGSVNSLALHRNENIKGSLGISDSCIQILALNCPGLQTIQHRCIGDVGLIAIGEHCRGVRCINFMGNLHECWSDHFITDRGIIFIAENCSQLEKLTLFCHNFGSITDESLISLGNNCHTLRCIHICCSVDVTDDGISALVRGCTGLTTVHITSRRITTDTNLTSIASHCQQLAVLHFTDCRDITETGFRLLAAHSRCLYEIVFFRAHSLTDTIIRSFATNIPTLRRIYLEDCPISWVDAQAIKQEYSQLDLRLGEVEDRF
jgi:hypothetical protein